MIWRTAESRSRSSPIFMAISMAARAARSQRSASDGCFIPSRPLAFVAMSAAARQISRMRCAASISPIGPATGSSQISFGLGLLNQRIAMAHLSAALADGRGGWNHPAHRDRRAIRFKTQVVFLAVLVGGRTDDAGDMAGGETAELHAPACRFHDRRHRQA